MNNKDDYTKTSLERLLGQEVTPRGQRRDPSFGHFAETHDDAYEEPDRDTDFDAGYQTDSVEEDDGEFDETLKAEQNDLRLAVKESDIQYRPDPAEDEDEDEDEEDDDEDEEEDEEEADDEPDDWLEEDDPDDAEEAQGHHWPMGLIAVAVVALVLLAAGGYGVMQQRAATEVELQQLRATLATSASPEEVRTSRGALQELQRSYDKLLADSEALTLENRRLTDTVAGLEAQLGVQQSALGKTTPVTAKPTSTASGNGGAASVQADAERFAPLKSSQSAAKPAPKPAQPSAVAPAVAASVAVAATKTIPAVPPAGKPAASAAVAATDASTGSGPWFVNFGSYAARSMAESWAAKLQPGAGKVIIAANNSAGKTLYRLRVVGLADRDTAKAVAHKLETELRVAELWVGKE